MGNIKTTTKISALKSNPSTEDDYLEAAIGDVLSKSRS